MTAQIPELLILDGEEVSMAFCPNFPINHPRILPADTSSIPPELELKGMIVNGTACWRGYQGTWEIRNNQLYLLSLFGMWQISAGEPLKAEWFSGVLRITRGEKLCHVHMGFGSVYEQEIHIRVDQGRVKARSVIDNRDKAIDENRLGWSNLPGFENLFEGDGQA